MAVIIDPTVTLAPPIPFITGFAFSSEPAMKRRHFLSVFATGLFAGSAAGRSLAAEDVSGESDLPVKPYLQNPTSTSMTVCWLTDAPSDTWVEYGTTPALGEKAFASIDGLKTAGRIQTITLAGLAPATRYFYRVVSRRIDKHEAYRVDYGPTIGCEVRSFTTFATEPERVRFTVFNDIHNRTDLWRELNSRVADFHPDFAVLNGDIMGHIDDESALVRDILAPAGEIFRGSLPFFYVRGNHETRGAFARELIRYLKLPGDRYYFARSIGPVRLVVLDSGEDKEDSNPAYAGLADFDRYRDIQQAWLRQEIGSPEFRQATYRVVIHHMPPLPTPKWPGTHDCYEKWAPLYAEGGVDLYIGGHTHRHAILPPSEEANRPYTVAIGGGPRPGEAVVITVEADKTALALAMIDETGKTVRTQRIEAVPHHP